MRKGTRVENTGDGWTEVIMPFVPAGWFNDHISVYFKEEEGKVTFSDDGALFHRMDLEMSPNSAKAALRKIAGWHRFTFSRDNTMNTTVLISDFEKTMCEFFSVLWETVAPFSLPE